MSATEILLRILIVTLLVELINVFIVGMAVTNPLSWLAAVAASVGGLLVYLALGLGRR